MCVQVSEVGSAMASKQVSSPAATGRSKISRDLRGVRSPFQQLVKHTLHRYISLQSQFYNLLVYYAPPLIGDAFVWRLSDVWRLSVTYIGPKSRTERPRKTKIGTEVAHVTRD